MSYQRPAPGEERFDEWYMWAETMVSRSRPLGKYAVRFHHEAALMDHALFVLRNLDKWPEHNLVEHLILEGIERFKKENEGEPKGCSVEQAWSSVERALDQADNQHFKDEAKQIAEAVAGGTL